MAYLNDFERTGSKTMTPERITRRYRVEVAEGSEESDIEDFVVDLRMTEPSIEGLPFADWDANEIEETDNVYDVTVNWGAPGGSASSLTQNLATVEYSFNFQAPTAHIYFSLETIAIYSKAGLVDPTLKRFGKLLNVRQDPFYVVDGLDIEVPAETFKLAYRNTGDVIDGPYLDLVEDMCGKVNSLPFRGKDAGELMLVRCTGGRDTSDIWYIEFGFGYQRNVGVETGDPITIGDGADEIIILEKEGMDYVWVFSEDDTKDLPGIGRITVPVPKLAMVERIFERANFNQLNLPF